MWATTRNLLAASTVALAASAFLGAEAGAQGLPAADQPAAQVEEGVDPQVQALIAEAERTRPVPAELIDALAMGLGDADQLIRSFISDGNPTPQEVAVRAIALSLAVGRDPRLGDPDRLFALNQSIGDGMSKSLGAPRILNVEVEAGFVPPEGTLAWDLGGLTTPVAEGFQQLTPYSLEVGGLNLGEQDGVGGGAVLEDVIQNLESLSLEVPNGQYRVVLLTAEDIAAGSSAPFGESFTINGVEYFLGNSGVGDWFDTAYLRAADGSAAALSYSAAGLSVTVEVGNGRLDLRFAGGSGSMLSGIVLEPIALPSRFDVSGVTGPRRDAARNQQAQNQQAQNLPGQGGQASSPSPPFLQASDLANVVALEFVTLAAIATVSGVAPAAGSGAPAPVRTASPQPPAPPFVSPVGVSPAS
ncbi:MAG: hypothetical protein WD341_00195 [Tistlia sp.]|uniref:hypothetical protein n=1 Tax=Tistlia sp. TaxID=3057121 RepID=UPI0034A51B69